jgi:hypothetical protein
MEATDKMMIGLAELTTDHPHSSYGLPVLLLNGAAYGPDDDLDGFPAGPLNDVCFGGCFFA